MRSLTPKVYSLFLLTQFGSKVLFAQMIPPFVDFSPSDYNGGNQNWGISQDENKLIYLANNEGLLVYNGADWQLAKSPQKTKIRSVKAVGERIYTGAYMDFGYWERDSVDRLFYSSLLPVLSISPKENEEFWGIAAVDEFILFQSFQTIYILNERTMDVTTIDSEAIINKIFLVDKQIYYHVLGEGIFRIVNQVGQLYFEENDFKGAEVINILNANNQFQLITKDQGIYTVGQGGALEQGYSSTLDLSELGIFSATTLSDGGIALGTISYGLVVLDEFFEEKYRISKEDGLVNNTVLALFEDQDENIWMGLDNGLAFVNHTSPVEIYSDRSGEIGSVYAAAIWDDKLYIGTNQGLFFREGSSRGSFQLVQETLGQVWFLKEIDGHLFCGHHNGTFLIDGVKAINISSIPGTWTIEQIPKHEDLLIQGNYNGLSILRRVGKGWTLQNRISNFDISSRYLALQNNKTFVNHEYRGVFQITLDNALEKATDVKIDTTMIEPNSGMITFNEEIIYSCRDGIYRFDELQGSFKRDSLLSNAFSPEEYISGRLVVDKRGSLWSFTTKNIVSTSLDGIGLTPKVEKVPIPLDVRSTVQEYENLILIDDDEVLIGTTNGFLIINLQELAWTPSQIQQGIARHYINNPNEPSEVRKRDEAPILVPSVAENFTISVHVAEYNRLFQPSYQARLNGYHDEWSAWETTNRFSFNSLPPGEYHFQARARVGDQLSANTLSYRFKIEKPLYLKPGFVVLYCLGFVFLCISVHGTYRRYYRRQREKLIEANAKELKLTQLQNEKEIIRLRNDQLSRDYTTKSKEAAGLALGMVKKNELLNEIKAQLKDTTESSDASQVLNIIDQNISGSESWNFFKKAFDNTDQDFFKKIKQAHPSLSPNDLKLCAYLRLNLTSKEIAPLFNISVRSVEIKRYRLRKKLGLSSSENLTDYVLNL
ncbi:MAG: two-component regulator propeller domain-containing protein [Bacteroidota bacterium]